MRENRIGVSLSIVLHSLVLLPFLMVPAGYYAPAKTLLLDFSLIRSEKGDRAGTVPAGRESAKAKPGRPPAAADTPARTGPAEIKAEPASVITAQSVVVHNLDGEAKGAMLSDEEGSLAVKGHASTGMAGSPAASGTAGTTGIQGVGGGGGSGRILNYGNGDSGLKEFAFIREAILKSIRYPEKARRMGWEGRVVLAFTVIENGSIKDIRVVRSSGVPLLDDDAREALRRTKFSRQVPSRLMVTLPVEYRLER